MSAVCNEPVDLAAVQADEVFLNEFRSIPLGVCEECGEPLVFVPAIGVVGNGGVCRHPLDPNDEAALHVVSAADVELVRWFIATRRDVESEPFPGWRLPVRR